MSMLTMVMPLMPMSPMCVLRELKYGRLVVRTWRAISLQRPCVRWSRGVPTPGAFLAPGAVAAPVEEAVAAPGGLSGTGGHVEFSEHEAWPVVPLCQQPPGFGALLPSEVSTLFLLSHGRLGGPAAVF